MQLDTGDTVLYLRGRDRLFGRLVAFDAPRGLWRIDRWCTGQEFDWVSHAEVLTSTDHERRHIPDIVRRDCLDGAQITTYSVPNGETPAGERRYAYYVSIQRDGQTHAEVDLALEADALALHEATVAVVLDALVR